MFRIYSTDILTCHLLNHLVFFLSDKKPKVLLIVGTVMFSVFFLKFLSSIDSCPEKLRILMQKHIVKFFLIFQLPLNENVHFTYADITDD